MTNTIIRVFVLVTIFLVSMIGVQAATLTCQQVSSASMSVPQFSSSEIEIRCSASGGTVSNVQITPNANPASGLTIANSQTIVSTITTQNSSTAKWSVTGDSPNTYAVSYIVSSDGTKAWSGASTTTVTVPSSAQLTVEYVLPPSIFTPAVETLDFSINNIGGTTANNVKIRLNSTSFTGSVLNYPTTIAAGASASYSWTNQTGFNESGTYTTTVYIGNNVHDSTTAAVNTPSANISQEYEADVTSSPSGGSAPATTTTVNTYTKAWADILAGETKTVTIDSAVYTGVPIIGLEFMTLNDLNSAELKVRTLTSAPSITGTITYTAYKYIQLVETNFNSDDLINTKVEFKVPKSWIETTNITKSNVALFRFINETWVAQETTITSEDADDVYYEAITSGFSYFAIGQLGEEVILPPVIPPVITPPTTNGTTPLPTGAVTGGDDGSDGDGSGEGQGDTSKGSGKRAWLWSLVIIIVIIILLFVFWKEGRFQKIIGRAHEKGLHKKEPKTKSADDNATFVDDKPPIEDNPKLDEFIKNEIALGHTKSEIKSALEHVGWSKEQIAEGFRDYNKK